MTSPIRNGLTVKAFGLLLALCLVWLVPTVYAEAGDNREPNEVTKQIPGLKVTLGTYQDDIVTSIFRLLRLSYMLRTSQSAKTIIQGEYFVLQWREVINFNALKVDGEFLILIEHIGPDGTGGAGVAFYEHKGSGTGYSQGGGHSDKMPLGTYTVRLKYFDVLDAGINSTHPKDWEERLAPLEAVKPRLLNPGPNERLLLEISITYEIVPRSASQSQDVQEAPTPNLNPIVLITTVGVGSIVYEAKKKLIFASRSAYVAALAISLMLLLSWVSPVLVEVTPRQITKECAIKGEGA